MDMTDRNYDMNDTEDEGIDIVDMAKRLWAERRMIFKWAGIAVVVALVVGFSIPKEYTVTVKLAPESSEGGSKMGGLGGLASMAGINLGNGGGADAVYPDLYPDIVSSVPFAVKLFDVHVTDKAGKMDMRLYDYVDEEIKSPWWSSVTALPGAAIGGLMSLIRSDEESVGSESVDPFRLSKDENNIVMALNDRIGVNVDSKTSVITISATMQDPVVAAMVADSVAANLREFITEYRTNKARQDLAYTQTLFDEAQADYFSAQACYAKYLDANHGIVLRSVRTEEERLQNEMNLAYSLYSQVAQQLQLAKAKIQENTPVYAVLQPATVPLRASKPSKVMILIGFVFLAVAGCSAWILFGRDMLAQFRSGITETSGN